MRHPDRQVVEKELINCIAELSVTGIIIMTHEQAADPKACATYPTGRLLVVACGRSEW